jgi:hypothetical protein
MSFAYKTPYCLRIIFLFVKDKDIERRRRLLEIEELKLRGFSRGLELHKCISED